MLKGLIKLTLSVSALTGAFTVAQPSLVQLSEAPEKEKMALENQSSKRIEQIGDIQKLEDIDIFGKKNGCTFTFVSRWKQKKVYNAEKFIKAETASEWPKRMIDIVKENKGECKDGKILTFFWKNDSFKVIDPKKW